MGAFHDKAYNTLNQSVLVNPEDVRLELEEADGGCMLLGQLADAVSVHVIEDSLRQLDE